MLTTRVGDQLIAGFCAGAASCSILHPLDLVKIHFQATSSPKHQRLFGVPLELLSIYRSGVTRIGGIRSLYRGFSANLVGSTAAWGLYFAFYKIFQEQIKIICFRDQSDLPDLKSGHYFIAAMGAGIATVLLVNPIWLAKTRICQPLEVSLANKAPNYKGLGECIKGTVRAEGISGLYRGVSAGLLGTSHGAIQFAVYEFLKRRKKNLGYIISEKNSIHMTNKSTFTEKSTISTTPNSQTLRDLDSTVSSSIEESPRIYQKEIPNLLNQKNLLQIGNKMSTSDYLFMSGFSKVFAMVLTYPLQTIRCRLQLSPGQKNVNIHPYKNIIDVFKRTLQIEGPLAFYKGLIPSIFRVLPGTCISFLVYERVSEALAAF